MKNFQFQLMLGLVMMGATSCTVALVQEVVLITMQGCPPCEKLKSQISALISTLREQLGVAVQVTVLDSKKDAQVIQTHLAIMKASKKRFQGYPTILIYANHQLKEVITGFTSVANLVQQIQSYWSSSKASGSSAERTASADSF